MILQLTVIKYLTRSTLLRILATQYKHTALLLHILPFLIVINSRDLPFLFIYVIFLFVYNYANNYSSWDDNFPIYVENKKYNCAFISFHPHEQHHKVKKFSYVKPWIKTMVTQKHLSTKH